MHNLKNCIIQNKQQSLSQYIQKRILLAGFSACGGSLQRHNSSPSQCDPARRAFLCYRNITEQFPNNIKNVSSDYLRRRVLPVLPLLFVSGLARGNLGRYVVIPLRCNRRACRCLKLLALSSASRKPSSTCSLHIPLSL